VTDTRQVADGACRNVVGRWSASTADAASSKAYDPHHKIAGSPEERIVASI
jgi:hypothetical protein